MSYEKPHRNMFDADGKYVSRTERTVEEEDIDYVVYWVNKYFEDNV